MLNEVILLLEEQGILQYLGKEKTLDLLKKIGDIGAGEDCNYGEILDVIGQKLNICYMCWNYKENLERGVCEPCRKR